MDRLQFLRNCAKIAAGILGVNQLDLLERIAPRTSYFFPERITPQRHLTLECSFIGHDGKFTRWMKPDEPVTFTHHVRLMDVIYHGPMPEAAMREFGIVPPKFIRLPIHPTDVKGHNRLTVALPEPLVRVYWNDEARDFFL
jgi:hypothetical protein